jgi:hypothetical protein
MASFRPALTKNPAAHDQAALGTPGQFRAAPLPLRYWIPLPGLQDRTHTSDLNVSAQHTRLALRAHLRENPRGKLNRAVFTSAPEG